MVWLSSSEAGGPKFIVPRHSRDPAKPNRPTCVYSMAFESTTASHANPLTLRPMDPVMEPVAASAAQPAPWREVFRGKNGRPVVGLLLFETLGAIHMLIVSTVMPAVLSDLGNLTLYGWAD